MGIMSCKKDEKQATATVSVQTREYTFNMGNKKLSPNNDISVNVKSDVGVESIYSYLIRGNKPDSLIGIFFPGEEDNIKDLTLSFSNNIFQRPDLSQVEGIKMMVKSLNNAAYEGFVKITAYFPHLPKLSGFPVNEKLNDHDQITIQGKAESENGITKIEIFDDSTGPFTLVHSIDNLNDIKSYNVNYTYTYRPEANNVQIVLYDKEDFSTSHLMKIATTPYILRTDLVMNAQGDATTNTVSNWVNDFTWTSFGSCDLHALSKNSTDPLKDYQRIAFLFYGTSSNATFYSPSNASSVAKNYICGSSEWGIPGTDIATLKATKFRALLRNQNAATAAVYANIESGNISTLDNTFFTGITVPGSSQAKYVESPADTQAADFNATTRNLIWIKVPKQNGGEINVILKIKEVNYVSTSNKFATIKFDMYVQK